MSWPIALILCVVFVLVALFLAPLVAGTGGQVLTVGAWILAVVFGFMCLLGLLGVGTRRS